MSNLDIPFLQYLFGLISDLHSNEHPSPDILFESSHSSSFSTTPFPHIFGIHTSVLLGVSVIIHSVIYIYIY